MSPRRRSQSVTLIGVIAITAFMTGCGKSSSTIAQNSSAPPAAATTEIQAEQNALPSRVAAAIPKDLKCSDEIVWVNVSRRNYHEPGDPFYGRTKHGKYMCLADAAAKGYHVAGMMRAHSHSRSMQAYPTNTP